MNFFRTDFFSLYQDWCDPYLFWSLCLTMLLLGMVGFTPLTAHKDLTSHEVTQLYLRKGLFILIGVEVILLLGFGMSINATIGQILTDKLLKHYAKVWGSLAVVALLVGFAIRVLWHRLAVPRLSATMRRFRVTQAEPTISDMKKEVSKYKALDFDPRDFYRPDQIFLGLNQETREPVYSELDVWDETNKIVVGATRFGKGITFQAWITQAIRRGHTVVYIDPKKDKWLPMVMREAAEQAGRPFFEVDINDEDAPGGYSPFVGGSARDRRNRFFEIMRLVPTGKESDVYVNKCRELIFPAFDDPGQQTTLPALLTLLERIEAEETGNREEDTLRRKALSGLKGQLAEWSSFKKLRPRRGFDVERTLRNPAGAVVYFRGSLDDNTILSATKAFIIELRQEIKRLEADRPTRVEVLVDEVKFLISPSILTALATIMGERATFALAFQTFGDLENPADATMNGKAVLQAVRVNCQFKSIFGGSDADTAEWIAKNTGDTQKRAVRMEQTQVNASGGEHWARHRSFGDVTEYVIPENVVKALPKRVSVLMRPNELACVISNAPVPVELPVGEGEEEGEAAAAE